jgi:hypothetical protein
MQDHDTYAINTRPWHICHKYEAMTHMPQMQGHNTIEPYTFEAVLSIWWPQYIQNTWENF